LIEPYTQAFIPLAPPGSFTEPNLPAGYAPFNIQQVGSRVFVTYAMQDHAKHDPVNAAGNGIVDIFGLEGNFVKRFASNGTLNSPWGVTQASAGFGQFSDDILIGNFGDGTINAFDPTSGTFLGQLKDQAGQPSRMFLFGAWCSALAERRIPTRSTSRRGSPTRVTACSERSLPQRRLLSTSQRRPLRKVRQWWQERLPTLRSPLLRQMDSQTR
jgi:uncharacterized protein (TIGR03118 family)